MTEILSAVRAFLKADTETAALVGTRVYGDEIPREEIDRREPRKLIVVRESGGIERNRFLPIAEPRFDLWSFAETYHEAGKVDRAAYTALKALDRQAFEGVLLHNAGLAGGPFAVRDAETGWPAKWRAITVQADERDISG